MAAAAMTVEGGGQTGSCELQAPVATQNPPSKPGGRGAGVDLGVTRLPGTDLGGELERETQELGSLVWILSWHSLGM